MWNYGMGVGMGWWMWLIMGLGTIGFWLLVAYLVRMIMDGGPSRAARSRAGSTEPLRLLDERLARGEIEPDEYQRRRDLLMHSQ